MVLKWAITKGRNPEDRDCCMVLFQGAWHSSGTVARRLLAVTSSHDVTNYQAIHWISFNSSHKFSLTAPRYSVLSLCLMCLCLCLCLYLTADRRRCACPFVLGQYIVTAHRVYWYQWKACCILRSVGGGLHIALKFFIHFTIPSERGPR